MNWDPKVPMPTIEDLLALLALHKGTIISTSTLKTGEINQARVSGRLFVDKNGLGFVWEPNLKRFPETDEEVAFFEKWYPLNVPLPEKFKTADVIFKEIEKRKKR